MVDCRVARKDAWILWVFSVHGGTSEVCSEHLRSCLENSSFHWGSRYARSFVCRGGGEGILNIMDVYMLHESTPTDKYHRVKLK